MNKIVHPGVGDFPANVHSFRHVLPKENGREETLCRICKFGSYTLTETLPGTEFSEKADNLSMKVDILTEKSSTSKENSI